MVKVKVLKECLTGSPLTFSYLHEGEIAQMSEGQAQYYAERGMVEIIQPKTNKTKNRAILQTE